MSAEIKKTASGKFPYKLVGKGEKILMCHTGCALYDLGSVENAPACDHCRQISKSPKRKDGKERSYFQPKEGAKENA